MDGTYGKYTNYDTSNTIFMEYNNFLPFILPYLSVTNNTQFNNYIINNPDLLYQLADYLMYTLPNPRYSYYASEVFQDV